LPEEAILSAENILETLRLTEPMRSPEPYQMEKRHAVPFNNNQSPFSAFDPDFRLYRLHKLTKFKIVSTLCERSLNQTRLICCSTNNDVISEN